MTNNKIQEWTQRQRLRAQAPRMSHSSVFRIFIAFMSGYYLGFNRHFNATMRRHYQSMKNLVEEDTVVHQLSPEEMLGKLRKERIQLERRLLEEYGEYYGELFDPTVVMGKVFVFSEVSKLRLVRRFMMKFLSARMVDPNGDESITFTWITAGDSSAAGHGNLFDQSYTAILEDTVKDAFNALGIQFIAKNYGMGGYVSAPELAMCMESVFGPDIDVLMWDFSMMEQSAHHYVELWGNRAGVHRTKPLLFMFDSEKSERWERFLNLEQNGIGTILMNKDGYEFEKRRVPDSNNADILENMPEALQYFVCGDATEGSVTCDDPVRLHKCDVDYGKLCKEMKWRTREVCHDARYQTSWHPGWKDHLLRGRLLGFFILEILSDALIKYSNFLRNSVIKQADTETMLQNFYADEELDFEIFLKSKVDFTSWDMDTINLVGGKLPFRNHAICHTALLPAHARYNGILMENGKIGNEMSNFETGINLYNVDQMEDGILPLAFNPNDRQLCPSLEIDHKDFFYVKEGRGWLSVIVPNKSEIDAYGTNNENYQPEGIIMMCLNICPMDRCHDDRIGFGKLSHTKKLFMRVDDKPVTDVKRLEGCHFLTGENGIKWGPGQASMDGQQYEIKLRVEDPGSGRWLRVSSIIVL